MKRIALIVAASALAFPVLAMPDHVSQIGERIKQIRFANQIDSWRALDNRHLVLEQGPMRTYLIRLKSTCFQLKYARHVGITSSNNTIYAGFDYVTADGEQCPIESIDRVTKSEAELLRS